MFCPNCGKKIPDDSTFCEFCGSRIDDDVTQEDYSGAAGGSESGENDDAFSQEESTIWGKNAGGSADTDFGEGAGGKVHTDFGEDDIASSANGKNASGGSSKNLETNPVVIGVLVLAVVVLTSGFFLVRSGKGKADKAGADKTMQTAADSGNAGEIPGGNEQGQKSGDNEASGSSESSAKDSVGSTKQGTDSKNTSSENVFEETIDFDDAENTLNGNAANSGAQAIGGVTFGNGNASVIGENTAESASSGSVSQNTGDAYTPETYAISGGKWDVLQSGEIVYTQSNGTSVQNAWVENKGKYLYVDFTGCLMKNNYTADGFWVGDDGAWDKTKEHRTDDAKPLSGVSFGTDPKLEIEILDYSDGSTYAKAKRTYSFGYVEEFNVMPLGCSAYLLEGKDDFNSGLLMVVSRDQKTLTVSGAGETTEYVMQ